MPIFIVGMPRSGTTLVEQILASHPDVYGAGERPELEDIVSSFSADNSVAFGPRDLTRDDFVAIGRRYVEQIAALAPGAKRITDKMPGNFRFAGLIHLALPGARILHVRRNAMDTCFSCYFTLFKGSLNFTYNLTELGTIYMAYEALMAHWRTVLPESTILDIQYEDLVSDFEPQVRRMLNFCNLPWDERCLKFYESANPVRTASLHEVRRPLFKSSIGRWRPYAAWLGPLRETLERPRARNT
ncbi:MAG: sulfotransferase [Rhizomicrobium sp.]